MLDFGLQDVQWFVAIFPRIESPFDLFVVSEHRFMTDHAAVGSDENPMGRERNDDL